MRHKSNQIVIILIVVLLLAGVGVGLYFLIEHNRKQHDTPVKPDKPKAVGADDKCGRACSDPTFAGKTIVQQVNCQDTDGNKCDEKNCPTKPTLEKAMCPLKSSSSKVGFWISGTSFKNWFIRSCEASAR